MEYTKIQDRIDAIHIEMTEAKDEMTGLQFKEIGLWEELEKLELQKKKLDKQEIEREIEVLQEIIGDEL